MHYLKSNLKVELNAQIYFLTYNLIIVYLLLDLN